MFPHTVQLHRDFAKDGLVVVSLDVVADDWEQKADVVKFLTRQKADFPNYILKDTEAAVDAFTETREVFPTPSILVFDRTGQRVEVPPFKGRSLEEKAEHDRQFVQKLLAAK
jgi:hypothetical protein